MQPKPAPKVHPAPVAVDKIEPAPVPISKGLVVSMIVNILLAVAVAMTVRSTLQLQAAVRTAQEDVVSQGNKFASELEQLRIDVVTTSSENVVYLKVMLLKPGIDKLLARDIAHSVVLRSREHKRDPDLTLALIDVESNFNPNAVSVTGAMGLTQIMPSWKKVFGIDRDLHDVDTSIKYGLDILGSYEQIFGSLELALTAYNRGPNAVSADMKVGKVPYNGYAENILRTYTRIKSWTRP